MFDILIRNGTVIDGTRAARYPADVGVQDGRIAAVGKLADTTARTALDAAGMIVAPGFVDVHTHSDGWMLKQPHLSAKTRQGFTTEVLMLDGISYAPVRQHTWRQWLFYLRALDGLRMDEYRGWETIAEFADSISGRNAQNFMVHVPYANVRSLACGFGKQAVDDFQMRQIRSEIARGMDAGAVGLSTGLDYIVQCYATTDELVAACSALREYGGLYVTHMRYKRGLFEALEEAVDIGRRAQVAVHISHLKAQSAQQMDELLAYIDGVARREVDLTFDVYPYQSGSTMLSYLLPYDAWEDGPLAVLEKLQDPVVRDRFRQGLEDYRVELDQIRIAWVASKENSRHQGKLLSEYAREMRQPAEEALTNLLIEERLAVLLVFNEGDDALVRPLLQHDLYMMGSDGIYCQQGQVHPRMFGSAGRLLGRCVREQQLFSLEHAVYKLSGAPAARFGMIQRGTISEGNYADLVIFDPDTVADQATYEQPQQHTTGIRDVLVAGVPIIRDGKEADSPAEGLPGRFLRFRQE